MLPYVCLSHKQLPEQFTDTPYKAGTYVHYTKNYQNSLLTLVTCEDILVDREKEKNVRQI